MEERCDPPMEERRSVRRQEGNAAGQLRQECPLAREKLSRFRSPQPFIAKSLGHHAEWIHACKTGAPTTCNFEYAGWLTEANHLGNVAYRAGKKLEWDAAKLCAVNAPRPTRLYTGNIAKAGPWVKNRLQPEGRHLDLKP